MDFLFENQTLDLSRRELTRAGKVVATEPQVFDVLVYLIENRDRVVSKDDLIADIWKGRIVSESTLTSRINAARKAVGDSGERQRLIKTIQRKGFRFVADVKAAHAQPAAARPATAVALPDKPSIAVLPFQNMSSDPEQEYLADGITADLITRLSQTLAFVVISNNSSFAYKAEPADLATIARQLGVRYVVQGSVRRAGNRVRVTAHLVEALTGNRTWADNFDREIADIFAVQDDVTSAIVGALHPQLLAAEVRSSLRSQPSSLDAWTLVVRGMLALVSLTKENLESARALSTQAIEIASDYGLAHGVRAFALGYRAYTQWGDDWYADAKNASHNIKCTLDLASDDPTALFLAGGASLFMGRHRTGVGILERAVQLNPNLAMARSLLGLGYASLGKPDEGLDNVRQARRLSPRDPMVYFFYAAEALCYLVAKDYPNAVAMAERGLSINAESIDNRLYLSAAKIGLGDVKEAGRQVDRVLRIAPKLRLSTIAKAIENGNSGWVKYHAALREAGLPE